MSPQPISQPPSNVIPQATHTTLDDQVTGILVQIRDIVQDESLFERIRPMIQSATQPTIQQTVLDVYQLIVAHVPEVWERVAHVLDQLVQAYDTTQYGSYEEYVQRTFLDDGGQELLDQDIEEAHVEHWLGDLSMNK